MAGAKSPLVLWGDIHNHCGISYGQGSLENALAAAREHLDFCSVTGHAMWPDMPEAGGEEFAWIRGFHLDGFRKFAAGWEETRAAIARADEPGRFATFQGYEIHSRLFGDYHILSPDDGLPLVEAPSPARLVEALAPREVIAIPHHVGYTPGYRGCDWEAFDERISPVVEIYSKHGCGLSALSPFPYLHTMGPRDGRTVAGAGLAAGCRFGFAASTDHHAGYPGSWGDGRLAVLAAGRTRRDIWEAILARRTYAVTGDKIECFFSVNGTPAGGSAPARGKTEVSLSVKACDRLESVIIHRDGRPWKHYGRLAAPAGKLNGPCKLRVEMGWGRSEEGFPWAGEIRLEGGRLVSVEPCFRGRSVLAPARGSDYGESVNRLENRVLGFDGERAAWTCTSFRNPSPVHGQTLALVLEIEGDEKTVVETAVNGVRKKHSLGLLARGPFSFHLRPYNSEAFVIHAPVPEKSYRAEIAVADPRRAPAFYHAEVRQVNGQCAWLSPTWVG